MDVQILVYKLLFFLTLFSPDSKSAVSGIIFMHVVTNKWGKAYPVYASVRPL